MRACDSDFGWFDVAGVEVANFSARASMLMVLVVSCSLRVYVCMFLYVGGLSARASMLMGLV